MLYSDICEWVCVCVCAHTFWRQSWFVSCCRCCDFHFKLSFKSIVFSYAISSNFACFISFSSFVCVCIAISFDFGMCRKEDQYIWFTSAFDLLHWGMCVWVYVCVHDFHCAQQSATQCVCETLDNLFPFFLRFAFSCARNRLYLRSLSFIWPLFCQQFFSRFVSNGKCCVGSLDGELMWSARKTYMTTNKSQNYGHNCVRWFNDWKLDSDDGFYNSFFYWQLFSTLCFFLHYFMLLHSMPFHISLALLWWMVKWHCELSQMFHYQNQSRVDNFQRRPFLGSKFLLFLFSLLLLLLLLLRLNFWDFALRYFVAMLTRSKLWQVMTLNRIYCH